MPNRTANWLATALLLVGVVTAFRVVALSLSEIDLFVDEAQYWLWGQNLDLGYFSKPPLSAWVIRLTTELAGSSSPFWIRLPAPLFHGATAIILAFWAKREFGPRPAIWVAVSYVTLPIVAVGSALISTDTILAPFFALALLFYSKLRDTGALRDALLVGAMVGLAMMAKYAGVYFLLCAVLAAAFLPSYRISAGNALALLVAVLVVISPNIYWNISHDLTTLEHTLDNVDWVRAESTGVQLNFVNLAEFFANQFIVMGPILFAVLLYLIWKAPAKIRGLLLFSVPIVALVCFQALLSRAYANWAFTAYFAATLAVVPWLLANHGRWLWTSLAFNGFITLLLPVLTIFADDISLKDERPLFIRYLGRDEFSQQVFDLAEQNAPVSIVAASRDVLADLYLTGRDLDVPVYSTAPRGRPQNYYQQTYPFVAKQTDRVLFITNQNTLTCNGASLPALATFDTAGMAYERSVFRAFVLEPDCFDVIR